MYVSFCKALLMSITCLPIPILALNHILLCYQPTEPSVFVPVVSITKLCFREHSYLRPQATSRSSMYIYWQKNKVSCQKAALWRCELWTACEKTDDSKIKGYPWEIESLFPILQVLPELELSIHALCHVTLLSTGGRRVYFPPHCYWVWPMENEHTWQFWALDQALRRPCVFLFVLLLLVQRQVGRHGVDLKPLEVCSAPN